MNGILRFNGVESTFLTFLGLTEPRPCTNSATSIWAVYLYDDRSSSLAFPNSTDISTPRNRTSLNMDACASVVTQKYFL